MRHIAQLSPQFRRDLGLDDTTIDDLVEHEECGQFGAARQAVFDGDGSAAPGPCAPATSS